MRLAAENLNDYLQKIDLEPRCAVGDETRIDMLHDLSRLLLKSKHAKSHPQISALGFWLRRASIRKLLRDQDFSSTRHETVSRGVVIHFPPQNVDTLFLYSWALSFLCGNSNVVRLATGTSILTDWLVLTLLTLLEKYNLLKTQLFIEFARDPETMRYVCSFADARVIWGGDEKVLDISQYPTRPDGLTIPFSSRRSMSVIDVHSYECSTEDDRNELARSLFNDSYWFDQLACGSPSVICWIGDVPSKKLQEIIADLEHRLAEIINSKNYSLHASIDISKYGIANYLLSTGEAELATRSNHALMSVFTSSPHVKILEYGDGGGFFVHTAMKEYASLNKLANRKLQTVGVFGCTAKQIKMIINAFAGKGCYRIVPVGRALDFGAVWDGVHLLTHLTRRVVVNVEPSENYNSKN